MDIHYTSRKRTFINARTVCRAVQSASEIGLRNNGLSAHNAAVVAEILKSSTTVTYVDLRLNEFGDEQGAKALSEALKVNKTVKKLDLYGCGIGDDGAAALAITITEQRHRPGERVPEGGIYREGGCGRCLLISFRLISCLIVRSQQLCRVDIGCVVPISRAIFFNEARQQPLKTHQIGRNCNLFEIRSAA